VSDISSIFSKSYVFDIHTKYILYNITELPLVLKQVGYKGDLELNIPIDKKVPFYWQDYKCKKKVKLSVYLESKNRYYEPGVSVESVEFSIQEISDFLISVPIPEYV
jgi:hypothetical protein